MILSACSHQQTEDTTASNIEMPVISTTASPETTQLPTEKSSDIEIDAHIILDNEKTTINGTGVSFENNVLTVSDGGSYYITGNLSDGKIYVNSLNETKKVKLILAAVNISCSTDAPLFIENSPDETVLILQSGTQNFFSDTSRTIPDGVTDYATAAIYSKDDLQIEGDGQLTVTGNFGKGIFSKNDIDIRGGNISITAADDGIRGKDSVEIETGTITVTSGGDGIRTSEELEADKGNIDIYGGTITVTSELDAIQATGNINISGGTFSLTSAGGSTGNYDYQYQGMGGPVRGGKAGYFGFPAQPDSSIYEESSSDTPSTKGIKSDKSITISGGKFTLNCLDDCLHSPAVTVNGGEFKMASDDDGIHGDENVTVNGGSIVITNSYEGVESRVINITGGKLLAKSADDGFNAAASSSAVASTSSTGTEQTPVAYGNRMGGFGGMMDYDSSCIINMSDGYVLVLAEGDGIDSNGSVELSGGKMIVYGPTNGGNGALDYGGTFNVSGGTLLATGALGMAQSVTGNGVPVLNFNMNGTAKQIYTIADSQNNCKIAFTAPKSFQNVVFASDTLNEGSAYSVYSDGRVSDYTSDENGICFDGVYFPGTLLGTLS